MVQHSPGHVPDTRTPPSAPPSPGHAPATPLRRRWLAGALALPLLLSLVPAVAVAEDTDEAQDVVTGLSVQQDDGAALLSWNPVEGAATYEIERTPIEGLEGDTPAGPSQIVGIWRPDRTQFALTQPDRPSFADAGFEPGQRYRWRVQATFDTGLPNQVVVDPPSAAAGAYGATGASFGPSLDEVGVSGEFAVVNASSGVPSQGCAELVDFPEGAIAIADRGSCPFVQKVLNAQDAGAIGVIIVNDTPAAPINLGGTSTAVTIPSGMVWQADGDAIKAGLPATGTFQSAPPPPESVFSDPLVDNTRPIFGPEEFLTQFETSGAAQWTSHENEIDFADRLAEASERMRVETIGHTVLGRRLDMYILGYPTPLPTAARISRSPTVMLNCGVHGNEPAGREACLMITRQLALSDDPWVIEVLSNATVLVVPAINADGLSANTRGNATGQDLNRDHSLLRQPETFAFAEALRDYTPDAAVDGHEFGNTNTGDLPLLWPRNLNVAPAIHDEAMNLVRDFHFGKAAVDGWWTVPYPFPSSGAGLGQETILRNTLGLKNTLGMLLESRVQAGPTRPNAGGNQGVPNRYRRVYSHLWTYRQFIDYHHERRADVYDAVVGGRDYNIANEGPLYLEGNYPAPDNIPILGPSPIEVDPAPCGYLLTEEQYTAERSDGPTVQARLEAHGIGTEMGDDGVLVRMHQPLRGLIPLLLDPDAVEAPLIDGERVFDCAPPPCPGTVALVGLDSGVDDRAADANLCVSQRFDDQRPWPNQGAFVSHVTQVSASLLADGVISSRERAQLISTAAQSHGSS